MIKKVIWGVFFLLSANLLWSQNKQIRFKRLTIDDGLSLSSVYCIFQDSKGFMWFGTEDGLNRYDGKNFRIFRPDPENPNSISHKWVDQICENKSGILWFGSRGGLTSFNPKTEIFTKYLANAEETRKLSNDTVISLLEDKQNQLWVGTLHGLNRIDQKTKVSTQLNFQTDSLKGLRSRINVLLQDEKGNVWIGTSLGLYFYDQQSNKFRKLKFKNLKNNNLDIKAMVFDSNKLWMGTSNGLYCHALSTGKLEHFPIPATTDKPNSDQSIEKIFIDSQNRIWVGDIDGLYKFNQHSGLFESYVYAPDVSNSQSINPIKPIIEDKKGNIWYGTFGLGLYKIDIKGFISNYKNNLAIQHSLSYNSIHSMYEDRAGTIWLGTFGAGLSIYDPQSHKFDLITNNPTDITSLSDNFVWSMMEANDGSVWIGTNSKGISRYFPKTGKFVHYAHNANIVGTLSSPTVRFIFQDSKSTIWVATDEGGLNQFVPETGTFIHYKHSPDDNTSISNDHVRGICEDSNGMLWIGTRNGLNKFNPKTGKFKQFHNIANDPNSLSHNYVYTGVFFDSKGNLWVGTMGGGLNKMDIDKETFKNYKYNPKDSTSISDDMVFWIYEDAQGYIWLATNSGLNKYDPNTEKFRRFGLKDGLPNEVVYGALPDKHNNLWLSTNYGLSVFNMETYETKNYDVNDGLQSNEFNGGSFHLGESGNMYFGGIYGLNIINPENFGVIENKSEVAITKFEIFGKEVQVMPNQESQNKTTVFEKDGRYYLPKSIAYTKSVTLDYSNNFFSLEFASLNTPLPDKVQYAYMMENLDKGWNYSGNRNYVSYARLKPGEYTFKVKSLNPDGLWSKSIAELNITINPPFWKTWWFVLLEILATVSLIIFIYRSLLKTRTNKLLQAQNEQISLKNQQLSISENHLKELNATKDKFFSIISHDLKNPFTSLLSISDAVAKNFHEVSDEDKQNIFNRINSSVKYIYNLLDNLLTWSRSQSQQITFNPVNFNLSRLLEENVSLHRIATEKKGIKVFTNCQGNLMAFADREMIDSVVRNLISNAIKFSNQGGSIEVACQKKENHIEVAIKDEGTGISAENLERLFRIDVKYKATGTAGEKGTGLGLILCKEFVEKNGGEIKVESALGKGSCFRFSVPIGENDARHEK